MTTCEDLSRDDTKQWDHYEEEPRSYPRSPEPQETAPGIEQDHLTYLLDTVLAAQDKYTKMFPHMKYRINEEDTKSFEDITFCMLQQGLFIYDEYKKLNSKLNGDYLSVLNKRLISENDQLKKIKEQSNHIIINLNNDLAAMGDRIKELEEHLRIANEKLPSGDVELRARRSKERDSSMCK